MIRESLVIPLVIFSLPLLLQDPLLVHAGGGNGVGSKSPTDLNKVLREDENYLFTYFETPLGDDVGASKCSFEIDVMATHSTPLLLITL